MDANVKNKLDQIKNDLKYEYNRVKRECEVLLKTHKYMSDHDKKILEEATKTYMSLYKIFGLNHHDVLRIGNYIESFASEVPLTVIIDDPEDWATMRTTKKGMVKKEWCKRWYDIFRETYEDGQVIYRDNNRVSAFDYIIGTYYNFGLCNLVYDEMFPITLPYKIGSEDAEFYFYPFLSNRDDEESEFDTAALLFIEKKDGEQIPVNRYFRIANEDEEPDIGGWVEIDVKELEERIKASKSNLELSDLAYKLGDDIVVYPDGKTEEDVE